MPRGLVSSRLLASRPDPLAAQDLPVRGTLILRPGFDHWVRIEMPGFSGLIHHAQMERLEKLFAKAREEIEADSHRSDDRLHMHPVRLGEF